MVKHMLFRFRYLVLRSFSYFYFVPWILPHNSSLMNISGFSGCGVVKGHNLLLAVENSTILGFPKLRQNNFIHGTTHLFCYNLKIL